MSNVNTVYGIRHSFACCCCCCWGRATVVIIVVVITAAAGDSKAALAFMTNAFKRRAGSGRK